MEEKRLDQIRKALDGVTLTGEEERLLRWLSGWDAWTADTFCGIVKKCRKKGGRSR